MSALITTVIGTYRRPGLLQAAIRSALAQSCPRLEVLVSDDCSGDQTAQVVAEIARRDARVRYTCRPANVGAFANFSQALTEVRTPFFSTLSDDDSLFPDFYAEALTALDQHPEAWFCAGQTQVVENGILGQLVTSGMPTGLHAKGEGFKLIARHFVGMGATLYRTEVLQSIPFLRREAYRYCEDDIAFRISRGHSFIFKAQPFYQYDANASAPHRQAHLDYYLAVLAILQDNFNSGALTAGMERALLNWCDHHLRKWVRRNILTASDRGAAYAEIRTEFLRIIPWAQTSAYARYRLHRAFYGTAIPLLPPLSKIKAMIKQFRPASLTQHLRRVTKG